MLTNIKLDKIECNSPSSVKVAHLTLTFDTTDIMNSRWELTSTGMALLVKGNHNTRNLCWLMEKLKEKSKVKINHFRHNRKGNLNFNEPEEETLSLEGQICQYANQLIKAYEFMNEEKTLVYKTPARKTPAIKRKAS